MKKRDKLSDLIIVEIQKDISKGKYKAGDKIPAEPELMEHYSVGRSTIREAIKTLAISGVLKVQQGSGTFVNEQPQSETLDQRLRRASMEDTREVRYLLEHEIVKRAAKSRTTVDLEHMADCLNRRKEAIEEGQYDAVSDADIAFHIAIAQACGNAVLADLYQGFTGAIRNFFSMRGNQDVQSFAASHHLHEALYKAIRGKRATEATDILHQIISANNKK